jgi:hypothetical protein
MRDSCVSGKSGPRQDDDVRVADPTERLLLSQRADQVPAG